MAESRRRIERAVRGVLGDVHDDVCRVVERALSRNYDKKKLKGLSPFELESLTLWLDRTAAAVPASV